MIKYDSIAEYTSNAVYKPFLATKQLFSNYIGYVRPYTFSEWAALPEEYRVAALYVQFYPEIYRAWNKAKRSYFTDEHTGVETVIQYLTKNANKILHDPKRFSSSYLYKVAYNCLASLTRNDSYIGPATYRHMHECSNILPCSDSKDGEIDLFDTVPCTIDIDIIIDSEQVEDKRQELWALISTMPFDVRCFVRSLIGEKTTKQFTPERCKELIEILRESLKDYKTIEF